MSTEHSCMHRELAREKRPQHSGLGCPSLAANQVQSAVQDYIITDIWTYSIRKSGQSANLEMLVPGYILLHDLRSSSHDLIAVKESRKPQEG